MLPSSVARGSRGLLTVDSSVIFELGPCSFYNLSLIILITTVVLFFGKLAGFIWVNPLFILGDLFYSLVLGFFEDYWFSLGTNRAVIESPSYASLICHSFCCSLSTPVNGLGDEPSTKILFESCLISLSSLLLSAGLMCGDLS